jgi:acyl-CoA hydrolase
MTARILTPGEASAIVRPVDTLGVPLGPGQPPAFLHALGERDDFENLTVFAALLIDVFALFTKPGVHCLSGFFGPAERFLLALGADIQFVPSDFRRFTRIAQQFRPRVVAGLATPPDVNGWCSMSLHAGATFHEMVRAAEDPERVLVLETNPKAPRTFGLLPDYPHRIHIDQVDVVVESDREIFTLADVEPTDTDRLIAAHARPYITDGATLQTGIGGIPSTIASMLATEDGGDYGVHSEMFTTGLMDLHLAGKVTNACKGQFEGMSITTFAAGTTELYDFLDGNPVVRFLPVEVVNSPEVVSANRKMITINGALTIDLWGQAVADTIGAQQFSGIGGHEDFVSVAGFELEDRSLLCMPSTATVGGELVSRITAQLACGAIVTTPRHQLDLVVTECGVASLRGRTVHERAMALAHVAHPQFRDALLEHAEKLR